MIAILLLTVGLMAGDAEKATEKDYLALPGGNFFHKYGCNKVPAKAVAITLKDAEAAQMAPCPKCVPKLATETTTSHTFTRRGRAQPKPQPQPQAGQAVARRGPEPARNDQMFFWFAFAAPPGPGFGFEPRRRHGPHRRQEPPPVGFGGGATMFMFFSSFEMPEGGREGRRRGER